MCSRPARIDRAAVVLSRFDTFDIPIPSYSLNAEDIPDGNPYRTSIIGSSAEKNRHYCQSMDGSPERNGYFLRMPKHGCRIIGLVVKPHA